MAIKSLVDIQSILQASLFPEEKGEKCGPGFTDFQYFLEKRTGVTSYIKDLFCPIPKEGDHPEIAIAIDFLHTFTLNITPTETLQGKRLIDSVTLSNEALRLFNFSSYYFSCMLTYAGKQVTSKTNKGYDLDTIMADELSTNLFLNEMFNCFITEITTTRSRREIGTATVNFKNVRNYKQGAAITALYNNAESVFRQLLVPMLPIKIWAKGRLYNNYYFPIFDGYIMNTTVKDSAGFAELEIFCKDVLELARISVEMINPALNPQAEMVKTNAVNLQEMPFYGHDHIEIVKNLFVGGTLVYDERKKSFYDQLFDEKGTVINGRKLVFIPGKGYVVKDDFAYALLPQRSATDARRLLGVTTASATANQNSIKLTQLDDFEFFSSLDETQSALLPKIIEDDGVIHKDDFNSLKRYHAVNHKINKRKIYAWGAEITPYRIWQLGSPQIWTSAFSNRLEILQQVTENVYYDYYVDGAGNFHYHPHRFVNDFLLNDLVYVGSDNEIVMHKCIWPGVQVISPEELVNSSSELNTEELTTFLTIRGMDTNISNLVPELGLFYGTATDEEALTRFGYRRGYVQNPLFNLNFSLDPTNSDTKTAGLTFGDIVAASLLQYKNANLYTRSLGIIFRPELDIARPIYFVEDNTVFYVNSIAHSINIGGDATTTIGASFGRLVSEDPPDLQSFLLIGEGITKLNSAQINSQVVGLAQETLMKLLKSDKWVKYLSSKGQEVLARTRSNDEARANIDTQRTNDAALLRE